MGDEEIRNYLNQQALPGPQKGAVGKPVMRTVPARAKPKAQDSFKNFSATHLFCPKCQKAMPVREKLLLYLPQGTLYDYLCTGCHSSLGTRKS